MSFDQQYYSDRDEIRSLKEDKRNLISLLRHAALRNHPPSPGSCTPCERIKFIVETERD